MPKPRFTPEQAEEISLALIEAVARNICKEKGIDPDRKGDDGWFLWENYMTAAEAAIDARFEAMQ